MKIMKKTFFLLAALIMIAAKTYSQKTTTCVSTYGNDGNSCTIVYDDNNLEKYGDGFLKKGKLGKDYTVEPKSFMTNTQLIIVQKGDIIEFFGKVPDYDGNSSAVSGTVYSCIIRNPNGIGLLTMGYEHAVAFPYGTKVTFTQLETRDYPIQFFVRVSEVILGADCYIPSIGQLKKGTKISITGNSDGTLGYYSINGGERKLIK